MTETPRDPDFEHRIRASFARQAVMATLGATIDGVAPGEVTLDLPFRQDLTQQHGFLHAGIVTSVMDSACGYAALTLMEPGAAVLSVEFKVNLLAPARGERFRAVGRVVRAGRNVTVVSGEFRSVGADAVLVAIMTGTMMSVRDRAGLLD
ncbi:MAG: PaaI family thioesterase [Gemmatimonadales bacterium]